MPIQTKTILENKNCIDGMKLLDEDSVDLIVTDPPYGMSFMGKNWDKALPDPEAFRQMLRVLKPGAFAFVMCAPRSDLQARMSILLEDAGFDIAFTPIYWTFATGFPKAQNISKQLDKRNGRKQETYIPFGAYLKKQRTKKGLSMNQIDKILGTNTAYSWWEGRKSGIQLPRKEYYLQLKEILELDNRFDELIEREEAEREIIGKLNYTSAKTHSVPTVYNGERVQTYITKDATPEAQKYNGAYAGFQPKPAVEVVIVAMKPKTEKTYVDQVLSNGKGITWLDDCRIPYKNDADFKFTDRPNDDNNNPGTTFGSKSKMPKGLRKSNPEGRFPANLLVSDDSLNGSYSRYFDLDAWFAIIPKPSKKEKGEGNIHPTVKPIKLMSYLITLGSRPDEIVLDPFMGSGTTGISAALMQRNFIGYELEEEYFKIAEERINENGNTTQQSPQRRLYGDMSW